MKKTTVYQTSDEKLFQDRIEANQWQRRLDVSELFNGEADPIDVLDANTDQVFAYLKAKRKAEAEAKVPVVEETPDAE